MKKVLLLYGGMSTEHDVSLSSAKSILDNYDTNLFEITPVYVDKNNNWCLNNSKIDNIISFLKEFDIVFPIIHGYGGEDGKLDNKIHPDSPDGTDYECPICDVFI